MNASTSDATMDAIMGDTHVGLEVLLNVRDSNLWWEGIIIKSKKRYIYPILILCPFWGLNPSEWTNTASLRPVMMYHGREREMVVYLIA